MSIYLRFFNAVFAKGLEEPSGLSTVKWIISPEIPAPVDDPDTPDDETDSGEEDNPDTPVDESTIQGVPEVRKFYTPIRRRALSLVAARAGIIEY
jgi:hypothetical protein